jgi:hypothetical protein
MAQTRQRAATDTSGRPSTESLSHDTLYEVLSNRRRRYVIHFLQSREGDDGAVELGTLAEQIAAWEEDVNVDRITSRQRKTVYTALQQRHLPQMDDAGLVAFDSRAGTVTPTGALSRVDVYTEVVPRGDFPWSQYYLGLSGITTVLLVAVWTDAYPLAALPDIAWGVFCVTAFAVSAVVHILANRRMKLGTEQRPPEVKLGT